MQYDSGSDVVASERKPATPWETAYARRLLVTDVLVIVWAVVGAQIGRFGFTDAEVAIIERDNDITLNYSLLSAALILAWLATLALFATRDSRIVGTGSAEYRRIIDASLRLFGIVAIIAFLARVDLARAYILLAFPIGVFALVASRWVWRQWLGSKRVHGEFSARVLLVGSMDSVVSVARELHRLPTAGYHVVGALVAGHQVAKHLPGTTIPLSSDLGNVRGTMEAAGADTVIVTSSDELPPQRMRELSWSLDPGRQHLVVAPSLTDIGGPRIHMRPVAGLPLVHVETPRYEGLKRFSKRAFDVVGSTALIVLLLPLLLVVAVLVRLTTPGQVLFTQQRVGLNGRPFGMRKFRSMVVDAEARLAELSNMDRTEGNSVMFKMKDDPRVTPVGRFLRRYSIDELPQLFNVLGGSMSLVGPRPPLEREVAVYERHVHRRFLVKPGITGLWQVSGRSKLSWEDTVRLDLYYVENWSITGDLVILWRTARAVVERDGAY